MSDAEVAEVTEGADNPVEAVEDLEDLDDLDDLEEVRLRQERTQRCIESLVHACKCKAPECRLPSCKKMKTFMQHPRFCSKKKIGGCVICKRLITLSRFHSENCYEIYGCPVPFCAAIKNEQRLNNTTRYLNRPRMEEQRWRRGSRGSTASCQVWGSF